jgi:uncharacterized protein (DUF2461 family)
MYLEVSHTGVKMIGGVYTLEKDTLNKIRKAIGTRPEAFHKIIAQKKFKEIFNTIHGERSKILPPDLKAVAAKEPFVANKQFFVTTELPATILLKEDLLPRLITLHNTVSPLNKFLIQLMTKK